jgi:hypothetical protein
MYERLWIVMGTSVSYAALFFLNNYLFDALEFSKGVNWIYLPSGFRLMFVLVFLELGGLGVALSSIFISAFFYSESNLLALMMIGFISGFSPVLARDICHAKLGMDLELRNLSARKLMAVSVVFALVSASMHQVFYSLIGRTENFMASTAVMAFGDLVGTVIMLYIAKFALSMLDLKRP